MKAAAARRVAQELQLLRSDRMDVRFHGETMRPFLRDGDRLIVEAVSWDEIRIGDLITYAIDKFPTRRVVHRARNSLVVWCDGVPNLRFRVAREQVLGRLIAREREGARLHRGDPEWDAATERALAIFRRWRLRRTLERVRIAARNLLKRPRAGARG